MVTYIARRLIQGIIVLLVASLLCFVIFRYMGDPVVTLAGRYATFEQAEEVRRSLGLDKPMHVQYFRWLANAVKGNFGISYVTRVPALGLILERFPATFELAVTAVIMAFVLGVALGVVVALKPYVLRNRLIMAGSLGGISIPTFLMGILLIMGFAVYLRFFNL